MPSVTDGDPGHHSDDRPAEGHPAIPVATAELGVRILFGTHLRPWGGGEKWMLSAAQAMAERGHSVSLCAPEESEILQRTRAVGLSCFATEFVRDFDPVSFWRVFRHCRRHRIQVFCLNMDRVLRVGGLAARLAGVGVIIPRRGSEFALKGHLNYRFNYQLVATAVLVNSAATEQALCRNIGWRPRGRIHVLYNGLDLSAARSSKPRDVMRKELGLGNDDLVLINVGELTTRKNAALLISVLPELLDEHGALQLLLVGEGEERQALQRQVSELGLSGHVRLLGFRHDVADLLAASDVMVHTARVEGFGFAVAEAMAAGLPVVATNVSSLPEIVLDGHTGTLFTLDDAASLRQALLPYLADAELRRRHGESGRQRIAGHFELSQKMDELEEIFRQELQPA